MPDLANTIKREIREAQEYLENPTPEHLERALINYRNAVSHNNEYDGRFSQNYSATLELMRDRLLTAENLEHSIRIMGEYAEENPLKAVHFYYFHIKSPFKSNGIEPTTEGFEKLLERFKVGYAQVGGQIHNGISHGIWPGYPITDPEIHPEEREENTRIASVYRDLFEELSVEIEEMKLDVPGSVRNTIQLLNGVIN